MNEENKKNVLLLCLSPYTPARSKTTYRYKYRDEEQTDLDGFIANEASAKRLMEILRQNNEKLDEIVVLRSREANLPLVNALNISNNDTGKPRKKDFDKELQNELNLFHSEKGDYEDIIESVTHFEHYESVIENYAAQECNVNEKRKVAPTLIPVDISNFMDKEEIANAVTDAAAEVLSGNYDSIHLYVDFNGGPRIVMLLVMVVSNLLKLRKVKVEEMTYINFEQDKSNLLQNMDAISNCMEFVEGINEFVNFGRIRTLRHYFEKKCKDDSKNDSKDDSIIEILHELEDLTNNMQLCLVDYIMSCREKVSDALQKWQDDYQAKKSNNQPFTINETMFAFATEDILNGCRDLLYGDIPEMVLWCLDREFMQQALFLYEQEMPGYFIRSGILTPTDQEWEKYLKWYKKKQQNTNFRDSKLYYEWMNSYLPEVHPLSDPAQIPDVKISPKSLDIYQNIQDSDGSIEEAIRKTQTYIDEVGNGRITSNRDADELREILVGYLLIKRQFAGTRSMPGFSEEGNLWNYDEMSKVLKKAALKATGRAK